MTFWELALAIAAGIVIGAVALVVLSVLPSLLYIAWYFVCIEWPDSFRWWLRKRRDVRNGKGANS